MRGLAALPCRPLREQGLSPGLAAVGGSHVSASVVSCVSVEEKGFKECQSAKRKPASDAGRGAGLV